MKKISLLTALKAHKYKGRIGVFCEDVNITADEIFLCQFGTNFRADKIERSSCGINRIISGDTLIVIFPMRTDILLGYRFDLVIVEGTEESMSKKFLNEEIYPHLGLTTHYNLRKKYKIPEEWDKVDFPKIFFSGDGEVEEIDNE